MKQRLFLAGGLVLFGATRAFAQDEKVLGRDDVDFAQALADNHYPDLAKRLLAVLAKTGKSTDKGAIGAIDLNIAQDEAMKIEDLAARKAALTDVLAKKEKFVEDNKGSPSGEDMRNTLPDLYSLLGETFTALIKKETDERKIEALRSEGDGIFVKAEGAIQTRIDALKALNPTQDSDDYARLRAARYNQPHLRYFHALLYAPGSAKRKELCDQAEKEYEEFDLDFYTDDAPMIVYYAYVDVGLCLKELEKNKEAIASFDKVIQLRGSYGEIDPKTKAYPIPPAARDLLDIVCYATYQKILLLKDAKNLAEVVKVGKDYFTTIPDPFGSSSSMLLAKELAEAQLALGDSKGAVETGKGMKAKDPAGIGAIWGQDLAERAGGGGESYVERLRGVETKLAENKYDAALAQCRQILSDVAGTADEAEAGSQVWLQIGYAFQKRGLLDEAILAYQTGLDRYPRSKNASELLDREITCLQAAMGATRAKYYRERVNAATDRLVADYPNAPQAAGIQMKKAANLESDGKWTEAIEIYKRVEKASNDYTKARLKIGLDYSQMAMKLIEEKQDPKAAPDPKRADEIKSLYGQAEQGFKDTIKAVADKRAGTLDTAVLSALDEHEYLSVLSLARLYMSDSYSNTSEAAKMVATLEQNSKWTSDLTKGPEIQNLRGRLYLDQGQFDEAEKWVDDLYKRDKKKAAGPAAMLAQAYDQQGAEKRQAKPDSIEADKLWRKAAKYYWWSVELQVDGTVSQQPDTMKKVADRLYVYGLSFNHVPDSRISFVDWADTAKSADDWVRAAKIYEAALTQSPEYRMMINLGRTYGFLGKWNESAGVYEKLFEQEQVLGKTKQKLDPSVVKAKPELPFAYLEWGVAMQMAAQSVTDDKEKADRLNRCINVVFMPLNFSLNAQTSPAAYWGAEYHLVRALMERGNYKDADLKIHDLQNATSPTFDDGKFGYQKMFQDTGEELKRLLFK